MRLIATTALTSCMLLPIAVRADAATVFKHVIIIFQENRTPDNLFGSFPKFEPGVDVQASGLNSAGVSIKFGAVPLNGCYDIGHSHISFEEMLNYGADKEVASAPTKACPTPANPEFQYADNSTGLIQPYFDLATNYGFANRMFQTQQGPSYSAHQFIFTGTASPSVDSPLFASENMINRSEPAGCTAPPDQRTVMIDGYGSETSTPALYPCFERNTMGDLLDAAKITWKYYTPSINTLWTAPDSIQHMCGATMVGTALQCEGPAYANGNVVLNQAQVLTDIQKCGLAGVTWVIPQSTESDHASINNGTGPAWVSSIVNQVGNQPTCAGTNDNYWKDTAIFVTWDDWGGWADHVKPPLIKLQPKSKPAWGDGYTYGFRVPLLVVSAFTPAHYVDNTIHDFGSILYFIEKNFKLGFIGPGTSIYSHYDDWQQGARGDDMHAFFSLTAPKAFVPIATNLPAKYFQSLPPSSAPIDDE